MAKCESCEERQRQMQKLITEFVSSEANNDKPFEDFIVNPQFRIRKFSKDLDPMELKWHIDEENRIISAINENDWKFQFDNELPIPLNVNSPIRITKGIWHRTIKGSTDLIISIRLN